MTSRSTLWARARRAEAVAALGGCCAFCGASDSLEFAHVAPTGLQGESRGSYRRVRDVLDNLGSYVLLCWSCHQVFDRPAVAEGGVS